MVVRTDVEQLVATIKRLSSEKIASLLDYARFLEWQEQCRAYPGEKLYRRIRPDGTEELVPESKMPPGELALRGSVLAWGEWAQEQGLTEEDFEATLDEELNEIKKERFARKYEQAPKGLSGR